MLGVGFIVRNARRVGGSTLRTVSAPVRGLINRALPKDTFQRLGGRVPDKIKSPITRFRAFLANKLGERFGKQKWFQALTGIRNKAAQEAPTALHSSSPLLNTRSLPKSSTRVPLKHGMDLDAIRRNLQRHTELNGMGKEERLARGFSTEFQQLDDWFGRLKKNRGFNHLLDGE